MNCHRCGLQHMQVIGLPDRGEDCIRALRAVIHTVGLHVEQTRHEIQFMYYAPPETIGNFVEAAMAQVMAALAVLTKAVRS